MKKREVLTLAHTKNLSDDVTTNIFKLVYNSFQENDMFGADDAANRIFNCDKTGCSTDPNKKKQFFSKSEKDSYLLTPTCGKAMYTVLLCGSAAADFLPLCVVYKSKGMHGSWTNGGPSGCTFGMVG